MKGFWELQSKNLWGSQLEIHNHRGGGSTILKPHRLSCRAILTICDQWLERVEILFSVLRQQGLTTVPEGRGRPQFCPKDWVEDLLPEPSWECNHQMLGTQPSTQRLEKQPMPTHGRIWVGSAPPNPRRIRHPAVRIFGSSHQQEMVHISRS